MWRSAWGNSGQHRPITSSSHTPPQFDLAGVLMSVRQPFIPRHLVKIDGQEGPVVALTRLARPGCCESRCEPRTAASNRAGSPGR